MTSQQVSRAVRQSHIFQLLEAEGAASQSQIVESLAEHGIQTTQVTVSRDLEAMGAAKIPAKGRGFIYTLSEPAMSLSKTAQANLRRVLKQWVHAVDKSRDLLVLRTAPGAAHVVASAIDRSRHNAVLATISGDDTVLVIVKETFAPAKLRDELVALVGLS